MKLVGIQEIASMLRVDRSTVISWRHHGRLPEADFVISGVPIWYTTKIVDFCRVDSFIQKKVDNDIVASLSG